MQLKLSAVGSTFTALRRHALVAGALVATCGLVACGGDDKATTTTAGTTTGPTTGDTTSGTVTGTTTATTGTTTSSASCELSHSAELTPQSAGITMTATGGTVTPMPYMLFVVNPNAGVVTGTGTADANKIFAVSVFDYDYCDFAYDHGYSLWPTTGFNAGSFYLVDSNGGGTSLRSGDYTLGGATQSIYIAAASGSFGSGVTKEAVGAAVGGGSCHANFPTLTAATVSLTSAYTVGDSKVGVAGSIQATLSDGSVIAGSFASGTCTGSPSTDQIAALPSPDTCACTLSSTSGTTTGT